jgi:DNA-binding response OmpR family regulator
VPGLLERLRNGGALRPSRLMLVDLGVSSGALPAALAAVAHDYVQAPVASADMQARIQAQLALGAALAAGTKDGAGHDEPDRDVAAHDGRATDLAAPHAGAGLV